MNHLYQCTPRLSVVVSVMAMLVGGCQRVPDAPDVNDRKMAYDLLAQTGQFGAGMILFALVGDSVKLRLDSVDVLGLDAAVMAWKALAKEAGITMARHRIMGSRPEQKMLTDTGIVQLTVRSRGNKAQYDTLLAFRGIWKVGRAGWRLDYEEMKPLPPPQAK